MVGGPVPPQVLAQRLRAEADLLAASVSFDPAIREAMAMCFPSKLTDYTAAGLPILAHGPVDSAAVRWVRDNPAVGLAVETLQASDLEPALKALINDIELRRRLAQGALDLGEQQFAGAAAERLLFETLVSA